MLYRLRLWIGAGSALDRQRSRVGSAAQPRDICGAAARLRSVRWREPGDVLHFLMDIYVMRRSEMPRVHSSYAVTLLWIRRDSAADMPRICRGFAAEPVTGLL